MESPHETSLLVKAAWSAVIVLGLTLVAERVSMRIAGLLSGAPLTAVLVYFFVGRDLGIDYVVDSVPYSIAAFTGTLSFVLTYYWTSSRLQRYSALGGLGAAVIVFLAVAAVLAAIPFNLVGATALTVSAIALSAWLVRKIEFIARRLRRPVDHHRDIAGGIGRLALDGHPGWFPRHLVANLSDHPPHLWQGQHPCHGPRLPHRHGLDHPLYSAGALHLPRLGPRRRHGRLSGGVDALPGDDHVPGPPAGGRGA